MIKVFHSKCPCCLSEMQTRIDIIFCNKAYCNRYFCDFYFNETPHFKERYYFKQFFIKNRHNECAIFNKTLRVSAIIINNYSFVISDLEKIESLS